MTGEEIAAEAAINPQVEQSGLVEIMAYREDRLGCGWAFDQFNVAEFPHLGAAVHMRQTGGKWEVLATVG